MCDSFGRVVKATRRSSSTGNYASNSQYINYVIEFKYDGIDYYTTTYSGSANINNSTLAANTRYAVDSNAKTITIDIPSVNIIEGTVYEVID